MQRYDHEIGRLAVDVQAFQKRESLTGERLQAFGESVRRAERQTEAIAGEVAEQREFSEKLELLRAEIHRVEDRISAFETSTDSHQQELADHRRSLGLLDGKDRGFNDRLALIQTELASYREQVADQFHRLHIALDRHRRRQIEELERDLRDLKVTAFRPRTRKRRTDRVPNLPGFGCCEEWNGPNDDFRPEGERADARRAPALSRVSSYHRENASRDPRGRGHATGTISAPVRACRLRRALFQTGELQPNRIV